MADPAGTAIGLLGLAATAVDLLKLGYVAIDRKEEVQNLRGQLDLQALLLRRWAENVFFVSPKSPASSDNDSGSRSGSGTGEGGTYETVKVLPSEYCTVIRGNLERLVKLFEDGGGLVRRYTGDLQTQAALPLALDHQQSQQQQEQQKQRSLLFRWLSLRKVKRPNAFKWAVRDAARLQRLLQHVSSVRAALVELVPPDLERLKLQVLIDAVSEITAAKPDSQGSSNSNISTTAATVNAIRLASSAVAAQSPGDAPAMRLVEASMRLRQQLPRWLNQVDAARASAQALVIEDPVFFPQTDPPAMDLTRWHTQITSGKRGLNSRDVVIEWRLCDNDSDSAVFENDVLVLANLLAYLVDHPDVHLPRCLGYVKSASPLGMRYGLVLSLPLAEPAISTSGLSNASRGLQDPMSLYDAIERLSYPWPDLSLRFKIARDLACSVLHLLSAGMFHKGIRSSNVLLLGLSTPTPLPNSASNSSSASSSTTKTAEKPGQMRNANFSLVGFEFARLDLPGQLSRNAADSAALDVYRHPCATSAKWTTPEYLRRGGYAAEYDIYGLGVVLAELGLWRTMSSLRASAMAKDRAWTDDRFPAFLRRRVGLELPGVAGGRFQGAVDWCLSVEGPRETEEGERQTLKAGLLEEFERRVIKELMDCRA